MITQKTKESNKPTNRIVKEVRAKDIQIPLYMGIVDAKNLLLFYN